MREKSSLRLRDGRGVQKLSSLVSKGPHKGAVHTSLLRSPGVELKNSRRRVRTPS